MYAVRTTTLNTLHHLELIGIVQYIISKTREGEKEFGIEITKNALLFKCSVSRSFPTLIIFCCS